MSKEKVSIQELVDAISQQTGFSKKKSEDFLRVFQSTLEDALVSDGLVKIKGFGTFKLVWNAPRKSVNVQTQQEYVIPGHYKVSFIPEAAIKSIINGSESGSSVSASDAKPEINPLAKLNEQAEEIKMLISELQDVKPEEKKIETSEPEEVKKEEIVSEPVVVDKEEKPVVNTPVVEEEHHAPEDYKIHERDIPVEPKKKKSGKVIIPILFAVIVVGGVFYLFENLGSTGSTNVEVAQTTEEDIEQAVDTTSEKITPKEEIKNVVEVKPDTAENVVEKKETPKPKEEVVTPQETKPVVVATPKPEKKESIFEKKRVYKEFIGTEKIEKGSRLTLIAEKHYGHKNFWVYIYEANKSRIKNPGNLPVGFEVKLPKLPAELIDVNNPKCVSYAGDLEKKYASK